MPRGLVFVVGCILFLGLFAAALPATTTRLSAQEEATAEPTVAPTATPLPTPTAYPLKALGFNLIAEADIRVETDGPSAVRVASLSLLPGVGSLPFANDGPTVLSVQAGEVVVISDNAEYSVSDIGFAVGLEPVVASPGPTEETTVRAGEQVYVAPGAITSIRNDSDAAATILIVAVVPLSPTDTAP